MQNRKKMLFGAFVTLLALVMALAFSWAVMASEAYPTKPVRLIVPFSPGGSNDIVGRLIAAQLSELLGKQVVVENHPGAGGLLGTEMAAKAEPDGYTILIVSAAYAINPSIHEVAFDPEKAFAPLAKLGYGPNVLAVHPSVPVNSVKELVALAKEKPGNLLCATAGVGSFQHLASELFQMLAGIDMMMVQFKGGGPAMIDVIGGHTQIMLGSLIQVIPHIRSGKLKALGTGGSKRSAILPDVPTIAEAGVPGYEASNWWGLLAPAGTPPEIINRLTRELEVIVNSEQTQKMFEKQGAVAEFLAPAAFAPFIGAEMAKWANVAEKANIKKK